MSAELPIVSFRSLTAADLPLLHQWLGRPHVAEWWGPPLSLAEVETAYGPLMFADPAVTRIQTDPSPRNRRAIRCYEKAGFHAVGEVDTPDGRALLMVRDRAASAGG